MLVREFEKGAENAECMPAKIRFPAEPLTIQLRGNSRRIDGDVRRPVGSNAPVKQPMANHTGCASNLGWQDVMFSGPETVGDHDRRRRFRAVHRFAPISGTVGRAQRAELKCCGCRESARGGNEPAIALMWIRPRDIFNVHHATWT